MSIQIVLLLIALAADVVALVAMCVCGRSIKKLANLAAASRADAKAAREELAAAMYVEIAPGVRASVSRTAPTDVPGWRLLH